MNNDVASKLTSDSSLPMETSLIVSAKCLEFRTCELVLTARRCWRLCILKACKRGIQGMFKVCQLPLAVADLGFCEGGFI